VETVSAPAWVALVAAGAVGAPVRYLVDEVITRRRGGAFPWGTVVINVAGSFLFGLITGLGLEHAFPKVPRVVLGTGFCGAYTTFSTFAFETVRLLEEGAWSEALRNAIGTLLGGSFAAAVGLSLATV
jgi:fluoride exporter